MRTKTTILSAVALAAGLASASAQVYSANVAGYYNIALTAKKSTLITGQLPQAGKTTLLNNELINFSDQNAADGTVLLIWNGTGFSTYTFVGPASGCACWVDLGGEGGKQ